MIPAAPSPSPSPAYLTSISPSTSTTRVAQNNSPSKLPVDFSPPLIIMVVVIATAFLLVTYSRFISRKVIKPSVRYFRQWRRRRRRRSYLASSLGDIESSASPYSFGFDHTSDGFHVFSPYGLDESVIKTIPLSVFTSTSSGKVKKGLMIKEIRDCAVCLLEFEDNDYVRTLPICSHAFHVDCIDIWLRSHANCPLCRARIFQPESSSPSPFVPLMAARIRPSLDDGILESIFLEPLDELTPEFEFESSSVTEIVPAQPSPTPSPMRNYQSEDRFNRRDFLLKRSYSFGYERNFPSERIVIEPATASPWRYRRGGSFWNKRSSPFCSLTKHRVFSFRHYNRGINMNMKSPFFRRRNSSTLLFPLSESSHDRFTYTAVNNNGGGSRRSKSLTSPMFSTRSSISISSSRLRCGDPEALLSPERLMN